MMYTTIIFDLDGTLLNTIEDIHDAVNHVLTKYGYGANTLDETRSYVGNGLGNLMRKSLPSDALEKTVVDLTKDLCEYYTKNCRIKTKPYDGIMDVLERLNQKGYKMAIVSNKTDQAVKELAALYFGTIFQAAIGEKAGVNRKPAPDMVHEALRRLDATTNQALYIGDSEVDAATAKNAGMDLVSVSWGFRDRELLETLKPTYLIDRPSQILSILEGK